MSTSALPLKAVSPHPWSSRGKPTVTAASVDLPDTGREVALREPEAPLLQRPLQAQAVAGHRGFAISRADAPEREEGRHVPERGGERSRGRGEQVAPPSLEERTGGEAHPLQHDLVRTDASLGTLDQHRSRLGGARTTRWSTARPASTAPCQSRENVPASVETPPPPSRTSPFVESRPRKRAERLVGQELLRLQVDRARIPPQLGPVRPPGHAGLDRPVPELERELRREFPRALAEVETRAFHQGPAVDLRRRDRQAPRRVASRDRQRDGPLPQRGMPQREAIGPDLHGLFESLIGTRHRALQPVGLERVASRREPAAGSRAPSTAAGAAGAAGRPTGLRAAHRRRATRSDRGRAGPPPPSRRANRERPPVRAAARPGSNGR